jgi:hypothetical protein
MLPMISFKDYDHHANSSAMMKFSKNSHKICTIAVRPYAIESGARWWERNGGCGAASMNVNLGEATVVEAMGHGVGPGGMS